MSMLARNTYTCNSVKMGFTLIELSIVLVILGLLTGGILAGQSLIKASELRATTNELNEFRMATITFEDKYRSLPGDMPNATRFWGDNSTHCADAGIADGIPGTCNGDGDGVIDENGAGAAQEGEGYMFWNQLALAGLIQGEYSGIAGTSGTRDDDPGINVPKSTFPNGCYHLDSKGGINTSNYDLDYGKNQIKLGNNDGGGADCDDRLMTPEDAWNIDKKIDDGRPAYGKVIARYWDNECAAANDGGHADDDLDADYRLSNTDVDCSLIYRNFP